MVWQIEFDPRTDKQFAKLGHTARKLIRDYLRKKVLQAANPRDLGKPLRGELHGIWRYRVDKYRILCKIEDRRLLILVIEIGKRDSIYE